MRTALLSISALLVLATSSFAVAGIYDNELNAKERAKIDAGAQVVRTEDVDGSAWPKITVYQKLDWSPEVIAAIYTDYALHKDMFNRIIKSDPVWISPRVADIAYTCSMKGVPGGLPDENYKTRDTLSVYDAGTGQSYRLDFLLLETDNMKYMEGNVQLERHGNGVLVRYYSFIVPFNPALAQFIVKVAINQVKDAVTALNKRAAWEKANDPAQLERQLAKLQEAISSP